MINETSKLTKKSASAQAFEINKMKSSSSKPVTKVSSKPEIPSNKMQETKVQPSAPPMPVNFQLGSQIPSVTKNLLATKQFHLTNDDIISRQPLTPNLNPKL